MSSKPSSMEAAAREVIDSSHVRADRQSGAIFGAPTEATQLDLLRGTDGKLPANVFRMQRENPAQHRGPGRPKGARNKRNDDLAKLIAHKYGDPVEYMASLYAMPLDELCELLLIADGTIERREKLDEMLFDLGRQVRELVRGAKENGSSLEAVNRLAEACEALESVARTSQGKPGDLAIKALNVQLAAAKAVSEYVHSKKPVEAVLDLKTDGVLVMPGAPGSGSFDQIDDVTRRAGDGLAKMLASGRIEANDIAGLKLVDGQLTYAEDADFEEIGGDGEDG